MNVVLTGAYNYSKEQLNQIKDLGYNIIFIQNELEVSEIDFSNVDVVVANGLFLKNDIKKFKQLKFIQLTSAGLDRVPLEYISQNGIMLANARGVYSIPMAEWAVLKVLEFYKKTAYFMGNQKERIWEKNRDVLELTGKTVSIIGAGSVGCEVAKRMKCFDTYVIGVDLTKPTKEFFDAYYPIDKIDDALAVSDIVVLTLPLTEQTKGFFDKERLLKVKRGAVLVNISRGNIINEHHLAEVSEHFSGIALDVFAKEPLPFESNLWDKPNVMITPHSSFISDKISYRMFQLILNNLNSFIAGEDIKNLVNMEN